MSEKLKDCPFCGAAGGVEASGGYVQCNSCGVRPGAYYWNRRTTPQALATLWPAPRVASEEQPIEGDWVFVQDGEYIIPIRWRSSEAGSYPLWWPFNIPIKIVGGK